MYLKKLISLLFVFLFVSFTYLNTTVKASTDETLDVAKVLTNDYFNSFFSEDNGKKEATEFKILNFKNLIRLNSKGSDVKELQHRLNEYGYSLEEDGIFSSKTYDTVINFQYRCELDVDGIVGPNTLKMLNIPPAENKLFNTKKSEFSNEHNSSSNSLKNYISVESLEKFINNSDAKSKTNYYVWVDLPNTRVNVFKKSIGRWTLDRSFLCAPGKASTPTVKGHFIIQEKGSMFRAGSNTICKYWTRFYGNYLFHTILLDNKGKIQDGRVGIHLSHGCIRLEMENAKYIYYNIPYGTTVWIK